MARAGRPGVYIDADMAEGVYGTEFLRTFVEQMNSPAHKSTVTQTTHSALSSMFDQHMSVVARMKPNAFHHVYEYSRSGDAYSNIGMNQHRLWEHTRKQQGARTIFSWRWKAAQQYNPTYAQRRTSRVGWDAIRQLSTEDFKKLVDNSAGRRHKFRWRAPIMENGIAVFVNAQDNVLALPTFTGGGKAKMVFKPWVMLRHQHPGKVEGSFTAEWSNFWGNIAPGKVSEVIGDEIQKDAARKMRNALGSGKKVRARKSQIEIGVVTNLEVARNAGREQARAALKSHTKSIKDIERIRSKMF